MIIVRRGVENLPASRQDQVAQAIVATAEAGRLTDSLQRIYAIEGDSDLELEFWFQGCTEEEAFEYAAAAIRGAALQIEVAARPLRDAVPEHPISAAGTFSTKASPMHVRRSQQ